MTERPILFSGPMVRAILDGRKTQTRRVCKPQPHSVGDHFATRQHGHLRIRRHDEDKWHEIPCPYGQPGDRLWVRETWAQTVNVNNLPVWPDRPNIWVSDGHSYGEAIIYRADGDWEWCDDDGFHTERSYWKPSIHMPRKFCRLVLEAKAVRVERLQDISEADATKEGLPPDEEPVGIATWKPQAWFRTVWDQLNEKRGHGWDTNPWVWVIEFEVCDG